LSENPASDHDVVDCGVPCPGNKNELERGSGNVSCSVASTCAGIDGDNDSMGEGANDSYTVLPVGEPEEEGAI
jgi:hypothetical protein